MNSVHLTSKEWEKKAIRHTVLLTGTLILSEVVLIFRGFVLAKFMGPNLYGLWHAFKVVLYNSEYYNLGTNEGMKKEVPYYRGKQDLDSVRALSQTALRSGMLFSVVAAAILTTASLILAHRLDRVTVISLWIIAGTVIVRQFYIYHCKKFESEGRFYSRSKAELLTVWFGVPITIALMFLFDLYGFLLGIFLSYVVAGPIMSKGEGTGHGGRFRIDLALHLIKVGLPMILIAMLLTALKSADKLMILSFLGRTELGYYGMASVAAGFIGFLPGSLRSVLFPRIMEKLGEKLGDKKYVTGFLIEPSLALVFVTLLAIGFVFTLVPAGVKLFLPQYVSAIPSIKILALGYYSIAMLEVPLSILIGINLQRKLFPILIGALLVLLGLNFTILSLRPSIEGIALVEGLTFFGITFIVMVVTSGYLDQSRGQRVRFLSQIYLPFLYAGLVLILLDRAVLPLLADMHGPTFLPCLELIIFLLFLTPVFLYINRKINILDRVVTALRLKGEFRLSLLQD